MVLRRLRAHETDHELIWLLVSLVCGVVAWLWLRFGYPVPRCTWHDVTGLPCPGCGATRSVTALLAGEWTSAFLLNPLIFLGAIGVALYDLYALAVLTLRLPRLRVANVSRRTENVARLTFVSGVLINWAWLLHRGV